MLQQDPNVQEAEKELEEVTVLLRQSLANAKASPAKTRKTVPITEVCTTLYILYVQYMSFSVLNMCTSASVWEGSEDNGRGQQKEAD